MITKALLARLPDGAGLGSTATPPKGKEQFAARKTDTVSHQEEPVARLKSGILILRLFAD